jgi:hypothetical protein
MHGEYNVKKSAIQTLTEVGLNGFSECVESLEK